MRDEDQQLFEPFVPEGAARRSRFREKHEQRQTQDSREGTSRPTLRPVEGDEEKEQRSPGIEEQIDAAAASAWHEELVSLIKEGMDRHDEQHPPPHPAPGARPGFGRLGGRGRGEDAQKQEPKRRIPRDMQ